ncbi:MAG: phosphomannomutase/phosphoglucomutase [Acidobacteriota bacterium]|nr:phosphomannomutase/phosphoglucomutase [Acidobacteriota bacterium]MDW3228447.1 phosphomannomutase/phosphoglucomutase [Acidobacteriota bacterium]MDY0231332.1 phosphomannomutase/phosphoglucomutase [Candidatus Saccharicenans sp.]
MKLKKEIFREYDIRGVVGEDLNRKLAVEIGKGVATKVQRAGKQEVAVGRDCRLSSPELAKGLIEGLLTSGCQVVDLGVVPTPLVYFTVFYKKKEAAVMITGSHNPPEFNGFKVMIGEDTLHGPEIMDIYDIINDKQIIKAQGPGQQTAYNPIPDYLDYVNSQIKLQRPVKVVIDAGNGTAGPVAAPLFKRLGAEVIELYTEMDGRFPNHHPDPTLPEALKELKTKVIESGAELGLAYDGDADRIGAVDETGEIIWGDQLMIIFARDLLAKYPGAAIISEVKASSVLYDEIRRLGGKAIMWKTGHSLIKKKIKEERALLAGEMSGHIFFADRWFGFDDAIYASARLLEIISQSSKKLSEHLADLPKTYSTPEIRIYASDAVKFKIVELVKEALSRRPDIRQLIDIDGVRAVFDHGWGLLRASNTQPVIVLRFEANSPEALKKIQKEIQQILEEAIKKLDGEKNLS